MLRRLQNAEWLSVGGAAVAFSIAAVAPFLLMAGLALTDLSFSIPGRDGSWVGGTNLARAAADSRFLSSLGLSLVFTGITVPVELAIGLLVAVLLPAGRVGRALVVPIAIPTLLSGVAVGVLWKLLLQGDFGVGAHLLATIGLLSGSLLGSAAGAFFSIIAVDVWQWAPFCAIVLYATRLGLPSGPFLAARLDGASAWQVVRDVTLPGLRPGLLVCSLFRFADSLREFDKVVVMTNGGPGSHTELLSLYLWNVTFAHGDIGYGSALTLISLALALALVNGLLAIRRGRG